MLEVRTVYTIVVSDPDGNEFTAFDEDRIAHTITGALMRSAVEDAVDRVLTDAGLRQHVATQVFNGRYT